MYRVDISKSCYCLAKAVWAHNSIRLPMTDWPAHKHTYIHKYRHMLACLSIQLQINAFVCQANISELQLFACSICTEFQFCNFQSSPTFPTRPRGHSVHLHWQLHRFIWTMPFNKFVCVQLVACVASVRHNDSSAITSIFIIDCCAGFNIAIFCILHFAFSFSISLVCSYLHFYSS